MPVDHFLGCIFATPAAASDWQVGLHFGQRASAAIHDFADLPIANSVTEAHVHGYWEWAEFNEGGRI